MILLVCMHIHLNKLSFVLHSYRALEISRLTEVNQLLLILLYLSRIKELMPLEAVLFTRVLTISSSSFHHFVRSWSVHRPIS